MCSSGVGGTCETHHETIDRFIIVLFLLVVSVEIFDLNILNRLFAISVDGGSGRIKIWNLIIERYRLSSTIDKIFGHGFHAVLYRIAPLGISRYAHNSFLETLYDYGAIGLMLIVMLTIRITTITVKMARQKHPLAPAMVTHLFHYMSFLLLAFFEQPC